MGTVALDIETVSPQVDSVADVDFLDSRQFEILCVGVAHRLTPDSPHETDVLWRGGIESGDEYEVLAELCEWLDQRHYTTILTYNGSRFDERHLRGRAAIVGDEVGEATLAEAMHRSWQAADHWDLMHDIVREHGHRLSLEDAVEEHVGARPPEVEWNGDPITNADLPDLGRQYLSHRSGLMTLNEADRLERRLEAYVRADIEPLFDLADSLDPFR